jgi:hypothetical protein
MSDTSREQKNELILLLGRRETSAVLDDGYAEFVLHLREIEESHTTSTPSRSR